MREDNGSGMVNILKRIAPMRMVGAITVISSVVIMASCSSGEPNNTESTSESSVSTQGTSEVSTPKAHSAVEVSNCGYDLSFEKTPERVLIMNGASVGEAESMIALGLKDKVIANAQHWGVSDIPGMADKVAALPKDNLTLNSSMDVSAEDIMTRRPDLVLSTYSGGFNEDLGFASRETLTKAGINSLVTPPNCALGKTNNITAEEETAQKDAGIQDSLEYLRLLGRIFHVEDKAEEVVSQISSRIAETRSAIEKESTESPKKMLIVLPGMGSMNANGLPAVMSGGVYDSVIYNAGGVPSFEADPQLTMTVSPEQLAAAEVDLLVIGRTSSSDGDPEDEANKLFDQYPQWKASQNRSYVSVSDGIYFGPAHAEAVEKIAKAAYPDSFSQ